MDLHGLQHGWRPPRVWARKPSEAFFTHTEPGKTELQFGALWRTSPMKRIIHRSNFFRIHQANSIASVRPQSWLAGECVIFASVQDSSMHGRRSGLIWKFMKCKKRVTMSSRMRTKNAKRKWSHFYWTKSIQHPLLDLQYWSHHINVVPESKDLQEKREHEMFADFPYDNTSNAYRETLKSRRSNGLLELGWLYSSPYFLHCWYGVETWTRISNWRKKISHSVGSSIVFRTTWERRLSLNTHRNYLQQWSLRTSLSRDEPNDFQAESIKPNHARGYLIEIQQTLARPTIRNHFSVRTFFKFLLSRQLIQTNPFQTWFAKTRQETPAFPYWKAGTWFNCPNWFNRPRFLVNSFLNGEIKWLFFSFMERLTVSELLDLIMERLAFRMPRFGLEEREERICRLVNLPSTRSPHLDMHARMGPSRALLLLIEAEAGYSRSVQSMLKKRLHSAALPGNLHP